MNWEYFNNGVQQGGLVSPLMFTVYIDELICRLQKSGIGCFIGQEYYVCLLPMSVKGKQTFHTNLSTKHSLNEV